MSKKFIQYRFNRVKDYQAVFSSEEGKLVLYDLMKEGCMLKPTHSKDRLENDKNEGKRELILYILKMLNTDPSKLLDIMKNGQSEEATYV
jgi:hypothetical protein